MLIELVLNLALLVALSSISGFLLRNRSPKQRLNAIVQGCLFGTAAVLGMLHPFDLGGGLIFDGRSIVLSLGSLFFGPWAAAVSLALAAACRIYIGGAGLSMGLAVITSSIAVGLVAHHRLGRLAQIPGPKLLYLFGLVVHAVMLACMTLLPAEMRWPTLTRIGPAVLLLYPVATLLAGKILADQCGAQRMLETVRAANRQLEVTLHSIADAVISTDTDCRVRLMNPAAEVLTGWGRTEAEGRPVSEVFCIQDERTGEPVPCPARTLIEHGRAASTLHGALLVARDGSRRAITHSAGLIRQAPGVSGGVVLVFRDLTSQQAMRHELLESEARYRSLFAENAAAMLLIDPATCRIEDANKAAAAFYGWSRLQLQQMHIQDINTLPVEQIRAGMVHAAAGTARHFEFRHRLASGEVREVEVNTGPVRINQRDLLISTIIDVTPRRRAEAAMRVAADRVNQLAWQSRTGFWETGPDGRFTAVSPVFEAIAGRPAAEIVGRLRSPDLHPVAGREAFRQIRDACVARREVIRDLEHPIERPDGSIVWVTTNGIPVLDETGALAGYSGSDTDVTERRLASEALRESVREKEALLKEVHHRVKNNLQVISSLLRLESARIEHPHTRLVLADMQGRIRSMAILHETLYRSANLARVDLAAYLERLSAHMARTLAGPSERIRLATHLETTDLSIDEAIPCGFIVNELVSNAFKHAFPAGRAGTVIVRLESGAPQATPAEDPPAAATRRLRLTVADDGIGLPSTLDPTTSRSLGLQLVSDLTRQLDGTLEIERAPGTRFVIAFTARSADIAGSS